MGSKIKIPHHLSHLNLSPDLTLTLTQQPLYKLTHQTSNKLSKCSQAHQIPPQPNSLQKIHHHNHHHQKTTITTIAYHPSELHKRNNKASNSMREGTTSKTVSWSTLWYLILLIRQLGSRHVISLRFCLQVCLTFLHLLLALLPH